MRHFKEYIQDLHIQDLTTKEQLSIGISIIHVKSLKVIDFGMHKHINMNQTISVLNGQIQDIKVESDIITYKKGDCLFIPKNNQHRLRYCAGCELLVVYIPGLKNKLLKTQV
jgi:mannose-6-phosphate isomerase-like protein (cupin superfamily)